MRDWMQKRLRVARGSILRKNSEPFFLSFFFLLNRDSEVKNLKNYIVPRCYGDPPEAPDRRTAGYKTRLFTGIDCPRWKTRWTRVKVS